MKRTFRSPERQAESIAKKMAMLRQKKEKGVRGHEDGIHSVATLKRYEQSLKGFAQWRQSKGMQSSIAHATLDEAQAYLNERKEVVGQKALDADRHALQKLLHSAIETVKASDARNDLATKSRAYTAQQVEAIAKHQSPANALATRVAYACGLRAHELHTIRRESNGSYSVVGKGGLSRSIRMPKALAHELEKRRLETPVKVKDRGVIYENTTISAVETVFQSRLVMHRKGF